MNRTNIEWVRNEDNTQGYTWNPVVGCRHGCEWCYARKIAARGILAKGCLSSCIEWIGPMTGHGLSLMRDPRSRESRVNT